MTTRKSPKGKAGKKSKNKKDSRKRFLAGIVAALCLLAAGFIVYNEKFAGDQDDTSNSSTMPNQDNVEEVEIARPEKGTDGLPDPCLLIDDRYLSMELSDNGKYNQGTRAKKVAYDGEARCVFTSDAKNTVTISVIKDDDKKAQNNLLEHHPDARDTGTHVENFDEAWYLVDSDMMLRRGNLTIWLQFSFADSDQAMGVAILLGTNLQGLDDREDVDSPTSPDLDVETGQ